ncbi:glycosyltransferase [Nesterenkonia sandarakina]|uniref:glycosyltransferase n=1 Tax=Nesterenkonia sandarakina TaxID=272918 RepID=UPI0015E6A239|nr:glycosyltransferase [Nesterenkonia sandarakina]
MADFIPRPLLPANIYWTQRQMQKTLASIGIVRPDYVFVDQPLFPASHFPDATVIFRPTDLFGTPALRRAARRAAHVADGIAATSPGVLESVLPTHSVSSCVIENGVEFSKFFARSGTPKKYDFVYVGALDFRFDFPALISAAEALPTSEFAIFGPIPANVPRLPNNVLLRGSVAYERVADVMAAGRVGLMPFVANASNVARSPMKLYEYVAAGVPVVAPRPIADRVTDIAGLRAYEPGIRGELEKALASALSDNLEIEPTDIHSAADRDWNLVADQLMAFAKTCSQRNN